MSSTELVALGKRIAELRIALQLKQTELAYEAGASHRTLQRLGAGEKMPASASPSHSPVKGVFVAPETPDRLLITEPAR